MGQLIFLIHHTKKVSKKLKKSVDIRPGVVVILSGTRETGAQKDLEN